MSNELIKIDPVMMDLVHSSLFQQNNPFTEELLLVDILVANVPQSGILDTCIERMKAGSELEMARKENKWNPFEIKLLFEGIYVGEIPLEQCVVLSRLMDAGKKLKCKVSAATIHQTNYDRTFTRILAKVYLID